MANSDFENLDDKLNDVSRMTDDYNEDEDWSDDENIAPNPRTLSIIAEESKISPADTIADEYSEKTEVTQKPSPASISSLHNTFVPVNNPKKLLEDDHREFLEREKINNGETTKASWEKSISYDVSGANGSFLSSTRKSADDAKMVMPASQQNETPVKSKSRNYCTSTPVRNSKDSNFLDEMPFSSIREEPSVASTLSNSMINNVLKDVDLNDDTTKVCEKLLKRKKSAYGFAKKSYIQNNTLAKQEIDSRLLNISEKLSAMTTNEKPPLRPIEHEVFAKASLPFSVRNSMNIKPSFLPDGCPIYISPTPLSYFGFVSLTDELTQSIVIFNKNTHSIQVNIHIPQNKKFPDEKFFEITNEKCVMIMGNQSHEIKVRFKPAGHFQYRGTLKINVGDTCYSHTLIGYGGSAHVDLTPASKLKYLPSSFQYIMCPLNLQNFSISMKNIGERVAFIHLIAVDNEGHEIDGVYFNKKQFYLQGNGTIDEFTVTVRDHILDQQRKNQHNISVGSHGIDNIARYSSASTHSSNYGHLFDIKIYWGTERARQRAKKYVLDKGLDHLPVGELSPIYPTKECYTEKNDNEIIQKNENYLSERDVDVFHAQIRVITIKIGDDKATRRSLYHNSRPISAASVPDGFYCPTQSNTINCSTISIAPTNMTLPSRRKF